MAFNDDDREPNRWRSTAKKPIWHTGYPPTKRETNELMRIYGRSSSHESRKPSPFSKPRRPPGDEPKIKEAKEALPVNSLPKKASNRNQSPRVAQNQRDLDRSIAVYGNSAYARSNQPGSYQGVRTAHGEVLYAVNRSHPSATGLIQPFEDPTAMYDPVYVRTQYPASTLAYNQNTGGEAMALAAQAQTGRLRVHNSLPPAGEPQPQYFFQPSERETEGRLPNDFNVQFTHHYGPTPAFRPTVKERPKQRSTRLLDDIMHYEILGGEHSDCDEEGVIDVTSSDERELNIMYLECGRRRENRRTRKA